jgi:putative SWIM zinc finger domain protein
LDKREKIEAREKKKAEKEIEKEKNPDKPKKTSAASKAAKTKKIKKQIEGLDLLKDVMSQVTGSGVAACADKAFDKKYDELAKQLGDYYLPGVQIIFKRFLKPLRKIKNVVFIKDIVNDYPKSYIDELEGDYPGDYVEEYLLSLAVKELTKLRYIEKRARDYLNKKLENDSTDPDDNILYEALGGIWKQVWKNNFVIIWYRL